jgi:hypothetical protein
MKHNASVADVPLTKMPHMRTAKAYGQRLCVVTIPCLDGITTSCVTLDLVFMSLRK